MFLVVVVVLFPLVYLFNPRLSLVVLFAAIGWTFYQRTRPPSFRRKPPKRDLPTGVLKAIAPAGPLVGKLMGFPPNFKELITTSDGVTYWAKDTKARERLGYAPRDLETGLRQTLSASGS